MLMLRSFTEKSRQLKADMAMSRSITIIPSMQSFRFVFWQYLAPLRRPSIFGVFLQASQAIRKEKNLRWS
uniref:Uncharacterized protein n=1 Tax=Heterorhabditis bacteriophora TaxID=37862 RepID=A0A1I7XLN8_HETBA